MPSTADSRFSFIFSSRKSMALLLAWAAVLESSPRESSQPRPSLPDAHAKPATDGAAVPIPEPILCMLHTVQYGSGDCQYSEVWENRSLWQVKVAALSDWASPRSRRPTGPRLLFNLSRRPVSGRSRWKHLPRGSASPKAAFIGTSADGPTFWRLRSP